MSNKLYGAILGDIAGQPYEYHFNGNMNNIEIHNEKAHITDDTLMTLASADAVLNNTPFLETYIKWYNMYPDDKYGYGSNFKALCSGHPEAHATSYGNGCIMRLAPVIYANGDIFASVICTHNHPDSIRAAFLLDAFYKYKDVMYLGAGTKGKFCINAFDTLQIVCDNYHITFNTPELIKGIITWGGDTDTNASILGELSNALKDDLNKDDVEFVRSKLDTYQLGILDKFNKRFN